VAYPLSCPFQGQWGAGNTKGTPCFLFIQSTTFDNNSNFHNGGFGIIPDTLDGLIASNAITTLELNEKK